MYASARFAFQRSRGLDAMVLRDPNGLWQLDLGRWSGPFLFPVSGFFALITGLASTRHWYTWLGFLNGVEFGHQDPLFHRDVAFYVFSVPFFEALTGTAEWIVGCRLGDHDSCLRSPRCIRIAPFSASVERYGAHSRCGVGSPCWWPYSGWMRGLRPHTFFNREWDRWQGASFSDVYARLPALRAQVAIAGVAAVLIVIAAVRQRATWLAAGLVLYFGVRIVGVGVIPRMVHSFTVVPNELEKERPLYPAQHRSHPTGICTRPRFRPGDQG